MCVCRVHLSTLQQLSLMRVQWSAQFASSSTKSGRDSLFIWVYFFYDNSGLVPWGGGGWLVNLYNNHKSGRTWPLRKCCDLFVFVECSLRLRAYLLLALLFFPPIDLTDRRKAAWVMEWARGMGAARAKPYASAAWGLFAAHTTHKTETLAMHDLCVAAARFTSLRLLFYDPVYTHTHTTPTHTHTRTHQVENNGRQVMSKMKAIKSGNCCN